MIGRRYSLPVLLTEVPDHRLESKRWSEATAGSININGKDTQLSAWTLWPLSEIAALAFFVLPPMLVFSYKLITGYTYNCFGSARLTWYILESAVVGHIGYLLLRLYYRDSVKFNTMLICTLITWRIVLWSNSFQILSKELRTELLVLIMATTVILYWIRFYMSYQAMRRFSRSLVSQKKRRYVDDIRGIDLDLSYITRRIIAMGFPTETLLEQQFRNPADQVQHFFKVMHQGHYKVYNLCSERSYQSKLFERECHEVRFPDHNPCQLEQLGVICANMAAFCEEDASNAVAVHCKAGKGRTGLVIASFLLHCKSYKSAVDALACFSKRRTYDGKGVTIPSQIRYVHYYEVVMRENGLRPPRWLRLVRLEVSTELDSTWRFQVVTCSHGAVFSSDRRAPERPPVFDGDVKIIIFEGSKKLCHVWFNTRYEPRCKTAKPSLQQGTVVWNHEASFSGQEVTLCFNREELDGLHKKKKGSFQPPAAGMEVRFSFTEAIAEDGLQFKLDLERSRVHMGREDTISKRLATNTATTMFKTLSPGDGMIPAKSLTPKSTKNTSARQTLSWLLQDYDDLEYDTDREEIMTVLCGGHLLRSTLRCIAPRRRLCELHTTGRLHIAGLRNPLSTLVVDLAEDQSNILREEEEGAKPEAPTWAWRVRNPRTNRWELLEAENAADAARWEAGFADACRFGLARRDKNAVFSGFFWKLNGDEDPHVAMRDFEFEHWRLKLFVLKKGGELCAYSHRLRGDSVYCDFNEPGCRVEQVLHRWRGMSHVVTFKMVSGAEGDSDAGSPAATEASATLRAAPSDGSEAVSARTFAATKEDYDAFEARVAKFRQKQGADMQMSAIVEGFGM